MLYQALSVSDCRTASEMVAVYAAAKSRLMKFPVIRPTTEAQPLISLPPRLSALSAVLTLEEVEIPKIPAQEIIAAVAAAHFVSVADLKGTCRWHCLSNARHHAVALLSQHRSDLSLPLIGKLMNRDHTTILSSRRRWPGIASRFVPHAKRVEAALGLQSTGCG